MNSTYVLKLNRIYNIYSIKPPGHWIAIDIVRIKDFTEQYLSTLFIHVWLQSRGRWGGGNRHHVPLLFFSETEQGHASLLEETGARLPYFISNRVLDWVRARSDDASVHLKKCLCPERKFLDCLCNGLKYLV